MRTSSTEEIDYDETKADDYSNNIDNSWSSSTNWTISHGTLEHSITFESSDSPIDSESTQISPPLILHQPSTDSASPCEIKLCFMQKHEIRQVYVRSTARVYEIYYAHTPQSDNEYLCTVRCSIAERDGEFLQANGIEVVTPQYLKDNVGKTTEGRVTGEAKLCASEDDWVAIKVPEGNRVNCLQKHTTGDEHRSIEELYEATAQIDDADPCMSLTIRFLSLQNKSSVCIDEIYIFGDPINSDEVEAPAVPMQNQASSFMAMLVPTLLQLSKSGISQKKQDKDVFDSQRKEDEVGMALRTSDFADAKKKNVKEKSVNAEHIVQLNVTDKPVAEPTHLHPPAHQNLSRENHNISTTSNDASEGRIVGAIEQLLDRVSRIENICLRFEEKMVSPMNSMEMRLQQLEQQVEILAKNSQYSVVSGTRITAPSFTYSESNSSSLYNDGSEYRSCGASELEKKDLPCNKLSEPSDDMPVSSNPSHALPNLVISAPEFSCGEDEEENDIVESAKVSSQEMQKQVLSIDDALAAALSGFLSTSHVLPPDDGTSEVIASGSTTSEGANEKNEFSQPAQSASVIARDCTLEGNDNVRPSKYTQILAVAAPDFTEEDDEFENGNVIIASSATAPELASEVNASNEIASPSTGGQDSGGFVDLNKSEIMDNASSTVASEPYAEQEKFLHDNVHLKETSGVIGPKDHLYAQESICRSQDDPTACPSGQDDKVAETNVRDSTNRPQMNSHNLENAAESEEHDTSKGSNVDVMQNVPTLDFDIPILEVKFTANEDGDTKFSLVDLLGDTTDVNVEAHCVDESTDDVVTSEGTAFTVMGDDGKPLVDFGIYAADTFTNLEEHDNPSISSQQEVFIGLI
ncbi:putative mitochondrial arginine transporter BAC2-like [Capsicum annuum]|uniref:Uncharacterized protein n=1 Tax=Capsicum annuum TaxID=4072 RepID=A0A1U8EV83_CAPAN|nr:uncharacterized protein LOC107850841 [Capsicum annuum]KAF3681854.1 putative mitochondrial arginine transporter BAC2-like [Capsicum annuum]PHT65134.1 hypothetical protein T459_29559 [Capsicum annuum]